ncbi:F-box domain-containing protein [Thelonectria olida]|uniref:F-box domain-containing protein n=1 Tax=Thelonectria olida TaxID=1576542 RepID=A0A9P9AW06_9HYPO|nr:F-box domain-containing protein [Thelonectria olida]
MDSSPSPLRPSDPHGHDTTPPDAGSEPHGVPATIEELRRRWKGKEKAAGDPTPVRSSEDGEPLTLLKLPVDILRLILNEISHPDKADLLPLLLVSSTLHDITLPYIYSSFDIIWPEQGTYFRPGNDADVDALTYGLTSLALGSRFARVMHRLHHLPPPIKQGTNARLIKSFRISNGLTKWVDYYSVDGEAGMMLNTLVALALPKMTNLESFTWDMPTGLSSNVFMALACLEEDNPAVLDHVWIRWHEDPPSTSSSSSSPIFHNVHGHVPAPPPPPPMAQPASPPSPPSSNPESLGSPTPFHLLTPYRRVPYSEASVEYPTYSILPALRSIAALDVNQVSYLDELAILIERSKSILRKLRVSVATKSAGDEFTQIKGDQRGLRQYDPAARWPGESRIGDRRLGGVLGVVLARVYDIRRNHPRPEKGETETGTGTSRSSPTSPPTASTSANPDNGLEPQSSDPATITPSGSTQHDGSVPAESSAKKSLGAKSSRPAKDVDNKLALECLELARVPLHTAIAAYAFDWTVLTTLTILNCDRSDRLWRLLREEFRPSPSPSRRDSSGRQVKEAPTYHLRLKNIHVDVTTYVLLQFIKDTLAPHSLEVLFLHDRRRTPRPTVPIATVFASAVKRHYASLQKLLLDSSHLDRLHHHNDIRRMSWALSSEMILEVTSGCMPALKELSVCVNRKDWHTILQRLPNMRHLTALHIPSLGRDSGTQADLHLAQQIVDVITLRPEIRLCYLAIRGLCFEVVESSRGSPGSDGGIWSSDDASSPSEMSDIHPASDDALSNDGHMLLEDSDDASQSSRRVAPNDSSALWPGNTGSNKTYRLRRIAFYEENVTIFKARHGTL